MNTLKKKANVRSIYTKPDKCPFCEENITPSYKDFRTLKKFISERAKILGSLRTGACAKHQRILAREIKRARFLGLLPYTPSL